MTELRGKVLVVDDDPINRRLLQRSLEREGLTVEAAGDGGVALERLTESRFDIVVLDILMPQVDGFEVLATMKADPKLRRIPVVVISGLDEMDSVVRCIELGADDFLAKPFDPVLLRARIGAGLARKRLDDLEAEYIEQVGIVAEAAAAVEDGRFEGAMLGEVAGRSDALGRLARVFTRMAHQVEQREQRLQREVGALRIEIDQARAAQKVAEITESDYFRRLQSKVHDLRMTASDID
ncbi:MAG TPA: response regulator [Actinomycetota bacterium]|nr:response regulator [Actinomycetota bacterium]